MVDYGLWAGALLCVFVSAAMAVGAGIGGGSLFVASFMIFLSYDAHAAVPLSKGELGGGGLELEARSAAQLAKLDTCASCASLSHCPSFSLTHTFLLADHFSCLVVLLAHQPQSLDWHWLLMQSTCASDTRSPSTGR